MLKTCHVVCHIGIEPDITGIGNKPIVAANQVYSLNFSIDLCLNIKEAVVIRHNIFGKIIAAAAWDNPYRNTAFCTVYHFKKCAVSTACEYSNCAVFGDCLFCQCSCIAFAITWARSSVNMILPCRECCTNLLNE